MSVPWAVFEIFLNGFEAAFSISIVSSKVNLKSWVKKQHILLFWILLTFAYSFVNFSTQFHLISTVIFPVLAGIYIFGFTKDDLLVRIFWHIFPLTLLLLSDFLGVSAVMYFYKVPMDDVLQQGSSRFLIAVLSKLIESVIWYYLMKQKKADFLFKAKYVRNFVFISFTSFLLLASLYVFGIMNTLYNKGFFNLITNLMFYIFISFLFFFNILSKKAIDENKKLGKQNEELEKQKEELKKQNHSLKAAYHSELIKAYKTVRQSRYDIVQQLQGIWSASSVQKSNGLQKYVEAFEQINQQLQVDYDTGDELVDVVIAVKEAEAFHLGIALHLNGRLPTVHAIQSEDICIIIDHLLSRVLEEVHTIVDPDMAKVISLSLLVGDEGITISLENPTCGDELEIGMDKIQDIVDKYLGKVSEENEDYYRTILVHLNYPSLFKVRKEGYYEKQSD